MEDRRNIFAYLTQVLVIFGITMITMMVFTILFGDGAQEISTMFALGSAGIPIAIMLQFLVFSFLVITIKYLILTDIIVKKMAPALRVGLMMLATVGIIVIFICAFGWFPINMWEPWVMFFLCFAICFGCSFAFSTIKSRWENKKMEAGLKRLKEQWEGEEDDQTFSN